MTRSAWWTAIASVSIVAVLVVFLAVQDRRHGWPFSRHHDVEVRRATDAGRAQEPGARAAATRAPIELPQRQVELLGIRFESVDVRSVDDRVQAVATVVVDESRITHVHTRVAGWLEALYVDTTGQPVRAGEPLAAIFSQELYASQQEYVTALRRLEAGPASTVLDAARTRLEVLGMDRRQIERLERTRQAQRLVTFTAPDSGIVLSRGVTEGTAVDASTELFTLADLSRVWVIAEVPEAEVARVRVGSLASLSFPTAQSQALVARVDYIYPTLTERTRTVRVRLPVENAASALRPGMYGSVDFELAPREVLTVARDAVVDTGNSQHVFVHGAHDVIEPRRVKLGARLADRIEITEGLSPGEHVVTDGVFLIDSESRLRASGTAGHAGHGGAAKADRGSPAGSGAPEQHRH